MTKPQEPPRLLDTAPEGDLLELGLSAGRDDLPTDAQLGSLWDRVVSATGGPDDPGDGSDGEGPEGDGPDGGAEGPDGSPGPGPEGLSDAGAGLEDAAANGATELATAGSAAGVAGAAASGGAATKIAAVVAVAAVAVGVSVHYASPDDQAPYSTTVAAVASASASVSPPPQQHGQAAMPAPTASASTAASTTATASSTAAAWPTASFTASASASAAPPTEIELLKQARAALNGQPAQALALVGKAAQLYPRGALGQEREMIRIQALIGVGKRDQALAAARAFNARNPGTAYARRLRSLFPELGEP